MSDTRAAFHYFGTNSGQCVSYLDPKPEQISLDDIALSLSRQGRGVGHDSMSTAQHSLIVTHQMFDECERKPDGFYGSLLRALFHDGAEAYTGDMPMPLKTLLRDMWRVQAPTGLDAQFVPDPFKVIEARLNNAILHSLGLDVPKQEERDLIKRCDRKSIALEMRDVMSAARRETFEKSGYQFLAPREDLRIEVLPQGQAYYAFFEAAQTLLHLKDKPVKPRRVQHLKSAFLSYAGLDPR